MSVDLIKCVIGFVLVKKGSLAAEYCGGVRKKICLFSSLKRMGGGQIFLLYKNFVEFYCKAKKALRAGSDCG